MQSTVSHEGDDNGMNDEFPTLLNQMATVVDGKRFLRKFVIT